MCLIINNSKQDEINWDPVNGFVTVYKFMFQDPEGNLWPIKYGTVMDLDEQGYFVSDRKQVRKISETTKVEHGIHAYLYLESVRRVFQEILNFNDFLPKVLKKFNRPKDCHLVAVEFRGHKSDLVAVGESGLLTGALDIAVVFNKVKFVRVIKGCNRTWAFQKYENARAA